MMWPELNGDDEEYIPFSQRRPFRIAALAITILVVVAMVALTLGPYLSRPRVIRVPVTTTLLARGV